MTKTKNILYHFILINYQDVYEEEDQEIDHEKDKFEDEDVENRLNRFNGKKVRIKRKKIKPRKDDISKSSKCKKQKSLCSTQGDEVFFVST